MQTITIELQNETANKFEEIIQAFGTKELMFEQFLKFHIRKLKREISRMQTDLKKFETKFSMSSEEFFEKFENGELGDEKDFIIWSGVYEMQQSCKNKLKKLL